MTKYERSWYLLVENKGHDVLHEYDRTKVRERIDDTSRVPSRKGKSLSTGNQDPLQDLNNIGEVRIISHKDFKNDIFTT